VNSFYESEALGLNEFDMKIFISVVFENIQTNGRLAILPVAGH